MIMARAAVYLTLTSLFLASCSSEKIVVPGEEFPRRGEYSSVATEMDIVVKSESINAMLDISSREDLKKFIVEKVFTGNCEDGPLDIRGQSFQANWICLYGNRYRPVEISGHWTEKSLRWRVDTEVDGFQLWAEKSYTLLREAG